jgi:hypothetical protein
MSGEQHFTPIQVPLGEKSKEELVSIVEMMLEDMTWYVKERNSLLEDVPRHFEKGFQTGLRKAAALQAQAAPLYCGYPGSNKWEDEILIIKKIADVYEGCSIHVFEQPAFAVVEAVLRCAHDAGFDLVGRRNKHTPVEN